MLSMQISVKTEASTVKMSAKTEASTLQQSYLRPDGRTTVAVGHNVDST
jgi:hypothetical protein